MTIPELEDLLRDKLTVKSVSGLEKFPCANYAEYLAQDKAGQLDVLTAYDGEVVNILGLPVEKFMHIALSWAWILIALIMLILAFMKWNFFLLIGVPLALLGFMFSSPASMKAFGNTLVLVVTVYCIFSWVKGNQIAALLSGSYALSNYLTCVCRTYCDIVIRRSIDKSELVLVWLVLKRCVVVYPKRSAV
ncbi:MAG: hypothetical protein HQL22_02850 [Candidatus Omnitrophica bacterium]|nr:hypothetical protein [Candidatus Omnitrophota bacterium]